MTWSEERGRRSVAFLPPPAKRGGGSGWGVFPALLIAAAFLVGCRQAPSSFDLYRDANDQKFSVGPLDRDFSGLRFSRTPAKSRLTVGLEERPVILAGVEPIAWRGRVPAGAWFHLGAQLVPFAWRAAPSLEVSVEISAGGEREVLAVERVARGVERWLALEADLSRFAGDEVQIVVTPVIPGLPAGDRATPLLAWSQMGISSREERAHDARPSVLFVLVDTMRADHLTPYGYARDTSPNLAREVAAQGALFEEAYSQAPWTLPSMVATHTGREPGELLGEDPAAYGIPADTLSLSERFARLGYATAGYLGNPTMHRGNGFARGYATWYGPAVDPESMRLHGDTLTTRAMPWLRAHGGKPFFLYVHYIDPHDPYESPELVAGQSPFDPDYRGKVGTDWIHGIYTGRLAIEDPKRDVKHIAALYDSEIHYVDGQIGKLLAAVPEAARENLLIVVASDHGEELFDHGGWKHGQTLYDEQIHVPLLFRWDGRIPAGKRIPGTVRLLDLVPTLLAAAGAPVAQGEGLAGVDLLPVLTKGAAVPRRPAFSRHLASGPLRAAAIFDQKKLIAFNREEPWAPADELQAHLWKQDLDRLKVEEMYDLASDPQERTDLAGSKPEVRAPLTAVLHGELDAQLPGLKVVLSPCPSGQILSGSITFDRVPISLEPYFLGPSDTVFRVGSEVRLTLHCDGREKGLRALGDIGGIASLDLRLAGAPLPLEQIHLGAAHPYSKNRVEPSELLTASTPKLEGALVRIWRRKIVERRAAERNAETEARLRALGYIQ